MAPASGSILCVRRGGLGDTLLMLPVLAALRAAFPGRRLCFAGFLEFAELLRSYGHADEALSTEDLGLWALRAREAERRDDRAERAGEAVRGPEHPDGAAERALRRLSSFEAIVGDDPVLARIEGVRARIFDPRPREDGSPLPAQILAQLGLSGPIGATLVRCRAPVAAPGRVFLAPGAGSLKKCWPRERWLDLARRLAFRGIRAAVVAGPAERERDDPTRWPWPRDTEFLAGRPAKDLAREVAAALAFVGNDSGPSHLASALRVPTVVLFGGGRPDVYAPLGPEVAVLRASEVGPPSSPVEDVLAALGRAGVGRRAGS